MTESMIVAVGTTNAAKLSAVRKALEVLFPDKASALEVRGVGVKSGVSDQPMCDEETIQGATNRAQRALDSDTEAQFGIGIEGGCQKIGERWFEAGWTVVVDRNGTVGIGSSARYELSLKIMGHLLSGVELADVIDEISGETDVRSKGGAMGILTSGVLNRDSCYVHGIYFAFAKWISEAKYWA
ncbi:Non-canonical purine NTP phosphatase/PRRC1 [Chytriomyces sp. MP71]|nr:Non-canonical purine NTP phosphatase/PRRC1 [Chytriomyces sp. MP71]